MAIFGVYQQVTTWLSRRYLSRSGATVGAGARFVGIPHIRVAAESRLIIGQRFVAVSQARSQVLGTNHPCVLRTIRDGAELIIGDDCGMSGGSIVAALSVRIGNGCLIGANVTIADTDFHPVHSMSRRYAPMPVPEDSDAVRIGDNVFIGAGVYVLAGATIGDNSVIGAGSVVTSAIPANVVAAGVPARVIGNVREAFAL